MSDVFDYFRNCVHCGLCLQACPTYVERGDENDSPRGRIYLMQAVAEQRVGPSATIDGHLNLCLNCRGCETACPSGVQYGELLESYRQSHPQEPDGGFLDRIVDWVCRRVLPYPRRTRWLLRGVAVAHAAGLLEFIRTSGCAPRYAAALSLGDVLARLPGDNAPMPVASDPDQAPCAVAGLFLGCVSEAVFGHTNRATHRVLLANDCAVRCPGSQGCCGAIHYHAGHTETARAMARRNIDAFEAHGDIGVIVTNVAGCGLMLKGYDTLLANDAEYAERAARFASAVRDVHEFLVELPLEKPTGHLAQQLTYHDACHLCHGQGIRTQPRAVLEAIPGLELVPLASSETCCGAAGTYSLTQPDMASDIARRKLDHIAQSGAPCVAIGNAGCLLHLMQQAAARGQDVRFVHPIDVLDAAYTATTPSA